MIDDFRVDDAKLIDALLRSGLAETARTVAEMAGVDPSYAHEALRPHDGGRHRLPDPPPSRPRADVYEAIEDSASCHDRPIAGLPREGLRC
jgi:hypothetical protein